MKPQNNLVAIMSLNRRQVAFLLAIVLLIVYVTFFRKSEREIISGKVSNPNHEQPLSSISVEKNVFLIDSNVDTENVKLTPRVACAIESAARANHGRNIYFLYASHERLKKLEPTPTINAVLTYQNVYFDFVNLSELSIGRPLEAFIRSERIKTSDFPTTHLSDAMRLLVLWKYGGVYIDGDIIVRKSFDSVPSNFVCRQDVQFCNAVLGFNHEKDGLELLEIFMKDYVANFVPSIYGAMGPAVVTRVIKEELCGQEDMEKLMRMKSCKNLNLLHECYSISYPSWEKFVLNNAGDAKEVMDRVNKSLVVHFWNSYSKHNIMETDSSAAYIELAKHFCPRVLVASGDFF